MVPLRAHSIFDDFFENRWRSLDEEFKPMFHNRWTKDLDKMMFEDEEPQQPSTTEGETIKTSSVYTNKNGQESGKTVTTKKVLKDGKSKQ